MPTSHGIENFPSIMELITNGDFCCFYGRLGLAALRFNVFFDSYFMEQINICMIKNDPSRSQREHTGKRPYIDRL